MQNHHDALSGFGFRTVNLKHFPQFHQRQVFATHFKYALTPGQRMQIFITRLQGFHDRVQRQDKHFTRDFHRHTVEDSQSQRQQDTNRRA
ncbi:hypothetical protein D3C78_955640 [compost metagenome]